MAYGYIDKGLDEINNALSIKNTIPNVSAVVFKQSVISKVFNENIDEIKQYRNAGDWVTYIHMLKHGDISYSSTALNNHRRHDQSVTISGFGLRQLEEIASVQKLIRDEFSVDAEHQEMALKYLEVLYEQFGLMSSDEPSVSKNNLLNVYLT